MTEYKVWAYARSAAPNLPALEEQLAEVMREPTGAAIALSTPAWSKSTALNSGDPPCSPCSPPCSRGASMPSWCRALTG